jgi:malonyl-CoA/methylmalonyl-CoA synthetase
MGLTMNNNFYALIESRISKQAQKLCLDCDDGVRLKNSDLIELTARISRFIRMQQMQQGERLVVQVEKSAFAVALYLACIRTGVIYIPLNTGYTAVEVGYFLGDAKPGLFVCDPDKLDALRDTAAEHGAAVLTLSQQAQGSLPDSIAGLTPDNEIADVSADDIAVILYTSGTTGRSKGAMLSHENLASNALHLVNIWGFSDRDVLIHALPIYHVHGLFVALHCALLSVATMRFMVAFNADKIVSLLPEATVLMGVPTFYTRLVKHKEFTREACSRMRLFISGSAPLLSETFKEFEQCTGQRILERYGMTETGMLVSNPLDGERVAGTVGFPLPEVETRICDAEGKPVATGEVGVLEVRGPNVFKGYWKMPEKTAEEFRADGFFITGDLASCDSQGRITLVGRNKDMIISGGLNIYPIEIETCINEVAGVIEAAVIGVPHEDFGEAVVAVVARDASSSINEGEVKAALQSSIARFKQPKKIIFVDTLPRNSMGKVQKNVLRDQYAGILS